MWVCHFCGEPIEKVAKVYRSTVCPSCGRELKICLNCRFYDPGAHWQCRETITEPVRDKDRSNFCEYFQYADSPSDSSAAPRTAKGREGFDKLFGDGR